jgi:hypothetical protein
VCSSDLDRSTNFETMEQVLDGLEKTSEHLAVTLNLPPVSMDSARREWTRLKEDLRAIPPKHAPSLERVERLWADLRTTAKQQGRPVFVVSSLMAISTLAHVPASMVWLSRAARSAARRTGKVVGEAILEHYAQTLAEIAKTGIAAYWTREFRPYLRGAAEQFAPGHESLTERLLARAKRGPAI